MSLRQVRENRRKNMIDDLDKKQHKAATAIVQPAKTEMTVYRDGLKKPDQLSAASRIPQGKKIPSGEPDLVSDEIPKELGWSE